MPNWMVMAQRQNPGTPLWWNWETVIRAEKKRLLGQSVNWTTEERDREEKMHKKGFRRQRRALA